MLRDRQINIFRAYLGKSPKWSFLNLSYPPPHITRKRCYYMLLVTWFRRSAKGFNQYVLLVP